MAAVTVDMKMNLSMKTFRLLFCPLALLCLRPPSDAAAQAILDQRRDATVLAVEQVMPSVVNIATRSPVPVRSPLEAFERQYFGLPSSYISLGSGVVIDEAGY